MSGNVPMAVRWLSRIGVIPRAAVAQLDVQRTPRSDSVLDAARLAERTYWALDRIGHDVVLIARMGQNLAQFGLKYSHMGFAVRGLRRGEWAVLHLLNANDGTKSGIYQEGLVNFYSDQPYRFEADLVTLPKNLQATVLQVLQAYGKKLHCHHYSLTAYPWSLDVQNSNQWVLEVLASSMAQGDITVEPPTREKAQSFLRKTGYVPTSLPIGLPTQWVGPLLRDSICFTDQPDENRHSGRIQTVTVDSVVNWLRGDLGPVGALRQEVRCITLAL